MWRRASRSCADSAATTLTFQDTSASTFNVDLLLDNVQILLQSRPVITGQPQNVTVAQNSPASFTVTATGSGLTYQWRLGGVPIGGATGATYAIASAQPSQAGNYDVVVTGGGSVTSAIATLTVHTTPVITGQPQNATVAQNSPASFTVTATGLGLTYQWRLGGRADRRARRGPRMRLRARSRARRGATTWWCRIWPGRSRARSRP